MSLRDKVAKLAQTNADLRPHLVPLLKEAAEYVKWQPVRSLDGATLAKAQGVHFLYRNEIGIRFVGFEAHRYQDSPNNWFGAQMKPGDRFEKVRPKSFTETQIFKIFAENKDSDPLPYITTESYTEARGRPFRTAAPESIMGPGVPSEHPEVKAFLAKMEAAYRRYFPKGYYFARAETKFGSNSIYIAAHVLPKGQQSGGIVQNDPSRNTFHMHDSYDENGMKPRIKIEMSEGNALWGPNASNKEKVGWRNGTGKPEGAVRKFDKYFAKLAAMIKARDDIPAPR